MPPVSLAACPDRVLFLYGRLLKRERTRPLARRLALALWVAAALIGAHTNGAVFDIPNGNVAALKSAIATANTNAQTDTINLAADGLYVLTTVDNGGGSDANGLPVIATDGGNLLTINGNGAAIERSTAAGTPDFRIFRSEFGNIAISNLTIRNGKLAGPGGGLLLLSGTVTLSNCTIAGNNVSGASNGGGIFKSDGTLTLNNCLVSNNSAPSGGGLHFIAFNGTAEAFLSNCTFSSNTASGNGGAIFNAAFSSMLGTQTARMTVSSCTLSGNSAATGGGIANSAGGDGTTTRLTIGNTVLQAGASGANLALTVGVTISSSGYNLSSD